MKIIDKVIARIEENRFSGSSELLAEALASAFSTNRKVSLLAVSSSFGNENLELLYELARISQQDDFNNEDQATALRWLIDNEFVNE